MKATMDKTLKLQTRAMTIPLTMNFTLLVRSLMTQARPMRTAEDTDDKTMIS
jgi:hypothetical protein